MKTLEGRVAVVTGSAGGIGLATAEAFLDEGMSVVLADIDAEVLDAEVERLSARGDVLGVATDVRDPKSVAALGAAAVERFGTVHVIMNNAGISSLGPLWAFPLEEWERIFAVNLWGVLHGIRTFVPILLANGDEGHVLTTASMAAVTRLPDLGPYTASKHAVLGITDVLGLDLEAIGAPIGVSTIMPGLTRTRMNPVSDRPAASVAINVVDAIRNNRRYVYTDGDYSTELGQRCRDLVAAKGDVVPLPDG